MPNFDDLDLEKSRGDCIAFFHEESRIDNAASDKAGAPVYANFPYVKIISPGNDKEIINRRVKEADKERWPREWAAFKNKEKIVIEGTAIEEWPQITRPQAMTLKASNIFTVENLADVDDQNLGSLGMGMIELKKRAQVFLKMQSGEAKVQKYAQQTRRAEEQMKRSEETIANLQEQVAGLEAKLATLSREVEGTPTS